MEIKMTYGPIDFIALEFKNENLKGEILPALLDLVEKQIVKIVDLVIIQKNEDGTHAALEMNQLSPDMLAVFNPLNAEISGIIQVEDIESLAEVMENGTTAAALLIENLWAIKFKEAVLKANGRVIEQSRIPHEDVEEAMAKIASSEKTEK
jgi:uncharacterized membrane protein